MLGHQLPEPPGTPVSELASLPGPIVAMLALTPDEETPTGFLVLGTTQGKVKRVTVADLVGAAHTSPPVIGIDQGDSLVFASLSAGEGEVLLLTASGQAIRFTEEDVRAMGLPAGGIGGIKLREGDRVVSGLALAKPAEAAPRDRKAIPPSVALMTSGGVGKRVPLEDFPSQGRNGFGVVAVTTSPRSGDVVGATLLPPQDYLVCLLSNGDARTLLGRQVPVMGRATQGKALVTLPKNQRVERAYLARSRCFRVS